MKVMKVAPAVYGSSATFQNVKDHIVKEGHRPLSREEVGEVHSMTIFLGDNRPVSATGQMYDWDQIARTTGWEYPIAE